MAKHLVLKGDTSRIEYIFIQNSSVTTGAGLTGLAYNSSGLTAYYVRTQGSATAITLATQTVTGAFSSGGFVEVDATNMPGVYRLDIPDACFATGVDKVVIIIKGATNMAPVTLEYQLVDVDLENATSLGISRLDAAITSRSSHAAADVWAVGTRALTDKADFALSSASRAAVADDVWDEARSGHATAGSFGEGVASVQGNVTGSVASVSGAVGSVTGNIGGNVTGSVGSVATGGISAASFAAGAIDAAAIATGAIDADAIAADAVTEIQAGLSTLTAAQVNAEVDTALADVNLDHLVGTATGIPAVPAGTFLDQIMDDGTATYDRTTDSLQAVRDRGDAAWATATGFSTLDAAGVRSAVGLASANLDTQLDALPTAAENASQVRTELTTELGRIDAAVSTRATPAQILTTALTEAYRTNGAEGTLSQILYELLAALTEFSIAGTTITANRIDHSTAAATYTLDSDTAPTSRTRAT